MDGDIAPLPTIKELCERFGAWVAIDDAHGTGVLGARGSGVAEHFGMADQVELTMGTFSKVFASTGGFVAGTKDLVDTLRFFSRSYMFSASLAIPVVASVIAGIDFIAAHPGAAEAIARQCGLPREDIARDRLSGEPADRDHPDRVAGGGIGRRSGRRAVRRRSIRQWGRVSRPCPATRVGFG